LGTPVQPSSNVVGARLEGRQREEKVGWGKRKNMSERNDKKRYMQGGGKRGKLSTGGLSQN